MMLSRVMPCRIVPSKAGVIKVPSMLKKTFMVPLSSMNWWVSPSVQMSWW
jgi:hypothetical protein